MGRFLFMLIKSSPSYNTLISSSYGSFPSSVRCEVWFCEAPMLVWLYTHLICPSKNLLQSAQFAGRRPLYFFLSPSSTHLASGDLLSQPARVIRFPNVANRPIRSPWPKGNKTAIWTKWFTWSDLHIVISTCEKSYNQNWNVIQKTDHWSFIKFRYCTVFTPHEGMGIHVGKHDASTSGKHGFFRWNLQFVHNPGFLPGFIGTSPM